jgi:predicted acylesterase/phospholipase RssA
MIEELCVAGACHRGISYIGAFKRLEELNILKIKDLKKIIGVSIGSFLLFCYISGYPMDDFLQHVLDTEIYLFKDIELCDNAILKGAIFRSWIYETMTKVPLSKKFGADITLETLYKETKIDFTIVSTCLETGIVYFNHKTHPNIRVYDALICSMNVPIVFPPYKLNGYSYIDGGLLENFPVHLLSYKGFGINSNRSRVDSGPFSQFDIMMSLISDHIKNINKPISNNIINIESDDSILNFDISEDDKITLYMRGYESINKSNTVALLLSKTTFKNVLEELINSLESFTTAGLINDITIVKKE